MSNLGELAERLVKVLRPHLSYTQNDGTYVEMGEDYSLTVSPLIKTPASEALELWREWFTKNRDPFYASEMGGDIYCFFCDEWQLDSRDNPQHKEDCIYIRAKRIIEGGVQNESA